MFPVKTAVVGIQDGHQNPKWPPKISEISMFCIRIHTYCNASSSGVKGMYYVLGPLFILLIDMKYFCLPPINPTLELNSIYPSDFLEFLEIEFLDMNSQMRSIKDPNIILMKSKYHS